MPRQADDEAESIASSTSGDVPVDLKPPYPQWRLVVLGMAWIGVQASAAAAAPAPSVHERADDLEVRVRGNDAVLSRKAET